MYSFDPSETMKLTLFCPDVNDGASARREDVLSAGCRLAVSAIAIQESKFSLSVIVGAKFAGEQRSEKEVATLTRPYSILPFLPCHLPRNSTRVCDYGFAIMRNYSQY